MTSAASTSRLHETPQKVQSAVKQGIRAVLNKNLMSGSLSSVSKHQIFSTPPPQQQQQEQDEVGSAPPDDSTPQEEEEESGEEGEESNMQEEDAVYSSTTQHFVSRNTEGDWREGSMDLSDSASQLRTSIHKKQRGLTPHDSPTGPQEWRGSGNTALSSSSQQQQSDPTLFVGSDSHLNYQTPMAATTTTTSSFPMSPVVVHDGVLALQHPHSAPVQLQSTSPGRTPNTSRNQLLQQSGGKGKFLRGKIKVSALKIFVGKGLDLGGSSSDNHHHHNSRSIPDQNTAFTSNNNSSSTGRNPRVGFADDPEIVPDHRRRHNPQEDNSAATNNDDGDLTSPQIPKGTGAKMASKMRKSIMGLKSLAAISTGRISTSHVAAAVLLDDVDEDEDDTVDSTPEDTPSAPPPRTTEELVEDRTNQSKTTESIHQEKKKARMRRKHKPSERLAKKSNHSTTATIVSADNAEEARLQSNKSRTKGSLRGGRLDPEAKERLKKHSEGNELRNRSAASRLRRQKLMLSSRQDSERSTGAASAFSNVSYATAATASTTAAKEEPLVDAFFLFGDGPNNKDDALPALAKESTTTSRQSLVRAPSGESTARKIKKKEENGKLRERVLSRQSFLKQNAPVKEPSISLFDLLEDGKQDDVVDDEDDNEGEDVTVADDSATLHAAADILAESEKEGPLQDSSGTESERKSSSGDTGSSSSSNICLEVSGQGSYQRIESCKSDDYWQLKIVGVPMKEASPSKLEEGTTTAVAAAVVKAERKMSTGGSSNRRLAGAGVSVMNTAREPEDGTDETAAVADKSEKKMIRWISKSKLVDSGKMDSSEPRNKGSTRTRSHHNGTEKKEGSCRPPVEKREGTGRRVKGDKTGSRKPRGSSRSHAHSPHRRHSDHTGTRRKKAVPMDDIGHNDSMPALVSGSADDSATNLDLSTEIDGGIENLGGSSSTVGGERSASNLDVSLRNKTHGSEEVVGKDNTDKGQQPEDDEAGKDIVDKGPWGGLDGTDQKRQTTGAGTKGKEKRPDRRTSRTSKSMTSGTYKHCSANASKSSGAQKHKTTARGRSEGAKKGPSSRGRSEARRESKRQPGKGARRHSLDAKHRVPTQEGEEDKVAKELGMNMKW